MSRKNRRSGLGHVVTAAAAVAAVVGSLRAFRYCQDIAFTSTGSVAKSRTHLRSVAGVAATQPTSESTESASSSAFVAWGFVAACGGILAAHRRNQRYKGRTASIVGQASAKSGHFSQRSTPLLDSLNDEGPEKVRDMNIAELKQLSEEVRWQVLDAVSVTGGHLGSALGVVELTTALHHVFDTPRDEICWDVAHQVYPHKILTGRRNQIYTLRQGGGLSGFAKRAESEYDAFGAGHSTTSISAAVGFQVARELQGKDGHSIAVIGDGAITGGMAWEAMNHAGGLKSKMIVILNDNGQVSLPTSYNEVDEPVGGLARTLAGQDVKETGSGLRVQDNIALIETSEAFQSGRQFIKAATKEFLPQQLASAAAKVEEYMRDFVKTVPFKGSGAGAKGELFEQLGFYYVGPIDGHNMDTLVSVLSNLKKDHEDGIIDKPIFLHVKTKKGKGYVPAETARDKLHAVRPKFNVRQQEAIPASVPATPSKGPPLTTVFGEALVREGKRDDKIVAITAAMPGGTGVGIFQKEFGPSRTFDVGIAEQHAVTFAGALAAGGLKPFCAIYSSFLQRGYDSVVHDVALQNLPVRFVLDRAGLVGDDGPTHGGAFDLSYLCCIPNLKICAPADEVELVHMIHTLAKLDDGPSAIRYPRGEGTGEAPIPKHPQFLEPGKGRIVKKGQDNTLAILSLGTRLGESLKAAERLEKWGIFATVADARWAKPIDEDLVSQLAAEHKVLITVEENAIGGFAAQVSQILLEGGHLDGTEKEPLVLRHMVIPDRFIAADEPTKQYDDAELNATHIMTKALSALGRADVHVDAPVAIDSRDT